MADTTITKLKKNMDAVDDLVNSNVATVTTPDGRVDKTFSEIQRQANEILANLGLEYPPIAYTAGLTVERNTQTYRYNDVIYINSRSDLPFTTSGAFDEGGWQVVQQINQSTVIFSADGIKGLDDAPKIDRAAYSVAGFYAGTEVGGGQLIYDASRDKADHNGGTVIAPEAIAAWDGTQGNLSVLLDWTGTGTGAFVRVHSIPLAKQEINTSWFGALQDETTEDSLPTQKVINALTNGGRVVISNDSLVGGLECPNRYVTFSSDSENARFIVKSGTLGFFIKEHWVDFLNVSVYSQGDKNDGLGTNGILYDRSEPGTPRSIGFNSWNKVTVRGFSGYGVKIVNGINIDYQRVYIVGCQTGVEFARDAGEVLFTTTVNFLSVYVTSCTKGIKGDYVYRSSFNVIGEFCDYAMDMFAGDFTLYRCYFEGNFIKGARVVNASCQDLMTYSLDTDTDAVDISYSGGVVPVADQGYLKETRRFESTAKAFELLSRTGKDPKKILGTGSTTNRGLHYDNSTIALVRGDNLIDPAAWESNTAGEFKGWNNSEQGLEVNATSASNTPFGIKQDVTLDSSKQYIIDVYVRDVQGVGLDTIRVGSLNLQSGEVFTPEVTGLNTVKVFGINLAGQTLESYVESFSIAELRDIEDDDKFISNTQSRLTNPVQGRGVIYVSATPTTGYWAIGERVYNSAPSAGGLVGWVCVSSGSPGTWKGFGSIEA